MTLQGNTWELPLHSPSRLLDGVAEIYEKVSSLKYLSDTMAALHLRQSPRRAPSLPQFLLSPRPPHHLLNMWCATFFELGN